MSAVAPGAAATPPVATPPAAGTPPAGAAGAGSTNPPGGATGGGAGGGSANPPAAAPVDNNSGGVLGGTGDAGGAGGQPGGVLGAPVDGVAPVVPAAAAPTVQEIVITLPQGAQVDQTALDSFKATAKEFGLTSEQASGLVAKELERGGVAADAAAKEWEKLNQGYVDALAADTEFGGDKLAETQLLAQKAFRAYGSEIQQEIVTLGLQNHPGLIKAFARMGRAMKEDNSGGPADGGTGEKTEDQKLEGFYNHK